MTLFSQEESMGKQSPTKTPSEVTGLSTFGSLSGTTDDVFNNRLAFLHLRYSQYARAFGALRENVYVARAQRRVKKSNQVVDIQRELDAVKRWHENTPPLRDLSYVCLRALRQDNRRMHVRVNLEQRRTIVGHVYSVLPSPCWTPERLYWTTQDTIPVSVLFAHARKGRRLRVHRDGTTEANRKLPYHSYDDVEFQTGEPIVVSPTSHHLHREEDVTTDGFSASCSVSSSCLPTKCVLQAGDDEDASEMTNAELLRAMLFMVMFYRSDSVNRTLLVAHYLLGTEDGLTRAEYIIKLLESLQCNIMPSNPAAASAEFRFQAGDEDHNTFQSFVRLIHHLISNNNARDVFFVIFTVVSAVYTVATHYQVPQNVIEESATVLSAFEGPIVTRTLNGISNFLTVIKIYLLHGFSGVYAWLTPLAGLNEKYAQAIELRNYVSHWNVLTEEEFDKMDKLFADVNKWYQENATAIAAMKNERSMAYCSPHIREIVGSLTAYRAAMRHHVQTTSIRSAPYTVAIIGGSGIAKSTLQIRLATIIMKAAGMKDTMLELLSRVYSWDPSQNFATGLTAATRAVILDDIAALQHCIEMLGKGPVIQMLLKICNNYPCVPEQAALEDKGTIPLRIHALVLSSNKRDLAIHEVFRAPEVVFRRINLYTLVRAAPAFSTPGGACCPQKMNAWNETAGTDLEPFWEMVAFEHVITNNANGTITSTPRQVFPPPEDGEGNWGWDKQDLKYGNSVDFFKFVHERSHEYHKKQVKLVESVLQREIQFQAGDDEIGEAPIEWRRIDMNALSNENWRNATVRSTVTLPPFGQDWGTSFGGVPIMNYDGQIIFGRTLQPPTFFKRMYNVVRAIAPFVFMGSIGVGAFFVPYYAVRAGWYVAAAARAATSIGRYIYATRAMFDTSVSVLSILGVPTVANVAVLGWTRFSQLTVMIKRFGLSTWRTLYESARITVMHDGAEIVSLGVQRALNFIKRNIRFILMLIAGSFALGMVMPSLASSRFMKRQENVVVQQHQGSQVANDAVLRYSAVPAPKKVEATFQADTIASGDFNRLLQDNGVSVKFTSVKDNISAVTQGLFITQDLCVINWHAIQSRIDKGWNNMVITVSPHVPGKYSTITFMVRSHEDLLRKFFRVRPDSDLCFFRIDVKGFQKRRSLYNFVIQEKYEGPYQVRLFGTDVIGYKTSDVSIPEKGVTGFHAHCNVETRSGDCGRAYVMHDKNIIVGIHTGVSTLPDQANVKLVSDIFQRDVDVAIATLCEGQHELQSLVIPTLNMPELGKVHPKSVVNWLYNPEEELGKVHLYVLGGFSGHRTTPRTMLRENPLFEFIRPKAEEVFGVDHCGKYIPHFGDAQCRKAHFRALVPLVTQSPSDASIRKDFETCADMYISRINQNTAWFDQIEILSDHEALNGRPGARGYEALNWDTSAGFPYNTSKRNFIVGTPGDYKLTEELQAKVDYLENQLFVRSYHVVFSTSLKDEVISEKKLLASKYRVFMASPIEFTVILRKYMLCIARIMQLYPFTFGAAVGVNPNSIQWEQIAEHLGYGQGYKIFDGDYVDFDKNMRSDITNAVQRVLLSMLSHHPGFNDRQDWGYHQMYRHILNVIFHPVVNYFGTFILFESLNPSGNSLTTQINCIANNLFVRYAFMKKFCSGMDAQHAECHFNQMVRVMTYGDDLLVGVRCDFSCSDMQTILHDIGIKFTDANKNDIAEPYSTWDNVTFLKRKFTPFEFGDRTYLTCPLDKMSILKMLQYTTYNKSVPYLSVLESTLQSAEIESFHHGMEFYTSFCNIVHTALDEYLPGLSTSIHCKDFLEHVVWFVNNCDDKYRYVDPWFNVCEAQTHTEFVPLSDVHSRKRNNGVDCGPIVEQDDDLPPQCTLQSGDDYFGAPAGNLLDYLVMYHQPKDRNILPGHSPGCRCLGCSGVVFTTDSARQDGSLPKVPSAKMSDNALVKNTLAEQTQHINSSLVEFFDSTSDMTVPLSTDFSSLEVSGGSTAFQLRDWFSRPVRVKTIQWSEGTDLNDTFNPWQLYFTHPEIYSKLKGFCRLRANLHVKMMINASPFQYSGILVSYTPLKKVTDTQDSPCFSAGDFDDSLIDNELMALSSRPHTYMYPQFSKGCQLNLPFFYYKDWLNLSSDMIALDNMGIVNLVSLDELRTATTPAVQPITISIFVWASNVELAGPSYVLQGPDEYSERPVSTAASAVSAAAKSLSVIAPIAKYAKATQMVADSTAALARWFGFSNPPVIADVHASRINYLSNFASPEISTQVDKLTLDPKQEVTVDPRTTGLGGSDEMAIHTILDRDVLIDRIDWLVTDSPGTALYINHVTPMVSNNSSYVGATTGSTVLSCLPTPSAHVGAAFRLWRGEITYKFTCLASQFHRGRLRVTFEPDGWQSAYTGSVLIQPRQISKIWDITQNSSIEFDVPYLADKPFLETMGCAIFDGSNSNRFVRPTLPGVGGFVDNRYNGSIILSVVNELVSSDPSAQIKIICEINCKNVEFADPGDINRCLSYYKLQGPDEEEHELASEPVEPVQMTVPLKEVFPIHDVFVGEIARSIRQLLHRHNRYGVWSTYNGRQTNSASSQFELISPTFPALNAVAGNDVSDWGFVIPLPRLPLMSGRNTHAIGTNVLYTDLINVNNSGWKSTETDFTTPTMTAYFSVCYAGWRGSHCYKACLNERPMYGKTTNQLVSPMLSNIQIGRNPDLVPARLGANFDAVRRLFRESYVFAADDKDTAVHAGSVSEDSRSIRAYNEVLLNTFNGGSGTAITNTSKVNVVDAVIPHYSSYRFLPTNPKANLVTFSGYTSSIFPQEGNASNALDDGLAVTGALSYPESITMNGKQQANVPYVEVYHSAGVDFSLFMYLNPPHFYKYGNSPLGLVDQAPFVSQL